jgi:hypothetical protein
MRLWVFLLTLARAKERFADAPSSGRRLIPIEIRPHVYTALTAGLADKPQLGQAQVIWPAISADRDRVRCGSPFSSVIGSSNFRDQDRGADTQQVSAFLDCCGSIFGSDFSGVVGQS